MSWRVCNVWTAASFADCCAQRRTHRPEASHGIAGLLTYFVRARKPESDLELANIVQRVRNTFLLVGCAALIMLSVWLIRRPAPPDHDTVSPLAYRGSKARLTSAAAISSTVAHTNHMSNNLDEVPVEVGELCI